MKLAVVVEALSAHGGLESDLRDLAEHLVEHGDEVQLVVTNLDAVEDLSHGMCVSKHDVNFLVNPRDTKSMTFTAGAPGVYWYYCPWFCHALHLEMRGRMIVEA